jgi:hypothetical protein
VTEARPDELNLDVYDNGNGLWNPDHGELEAPDGWEFLPSGDAFLTRRVKASGAFWVVYRPRGRNRPHRRLLGLWAPADTIAAAREAAAATGERRARARESGAAYRARVEEVYAEQLHVAIVGFLAFAPRHRALADEIAADAARRAAEVGSGRVGRTRTLTLEERAELAARACIRHRYTDYEKRLRHAHEEAFLGGELFALDDRDYYLIKESAQLQVDEFIERHRRR